MIHHLFAVALVAIQLPTSMNPRMAVSSSLSHHFLAMALM